MFTAVGVQRSGGTVALFTCSLAPKPLYFICIYIFFFWCNSISPPLHCRPYPLKLSLETIVSFVFVCVQEEKEDKR